MVPASCCGDAARCRLACGVFEAFPRLFLNLPLEGPWEEVHKLTDDDVLLRGALPERYSIEFVHNAYAGMPWRSCVA
jgi:hypothetical protein